MGILPEKVYISLKLTRIYFWVKELSNFSLIQKEGRIPEPFKTSFIDARTKEEAKALFRKEHSEKEAQIDEIQVNKFCAMIIWHDPKIPTV